MKTDIQRKEINSSTRKAQSVCKTIFDLSVLEQTKSLATAPDFYWRRPYKAEPDQS